jgi:hypothetical protein
MGRARQEAAQRQRVIGVVVISALLALGLLVWLPFQGQDAQYIEQCLAEWGTAHSGHPPTSPPPFLSVAGTHSSSCTDTDQDMNMDPSNCPKEMPPALRDAYTLNGMCSAIKCVSLNFVAEPSPGQIDVMLEYKCQTGPAYQKKHHYSQEQIDSSATPHHTSDMQSSSAHASPPQQLQMCRRDLETTTAFLIDCSTRLWRSSLCT